MRYLNFREPYMVEPAACRLANKTGMLMINRKSYAMQMGTVKSYTDFTEGSLDLKHDCQVGTHTQGGVIIDHQVMEVSVRMEWAIGNEVWRMITTTSSLTAPVRTGA